MTQKRMFAVLSWDVLKQPVAQHVLAEVALALHDLVEAVEWYDLAAVHVPVAKVVAQKSLWVMVQIEQVD